MKAFYKITKTHLNCFKDVFKSKGLSFLLCLGKVGTIKTSLPLNCDLYRVDIVHLS